MSKSSVVPHGLLPTADDPTEGVERMPALEREHVQRVYDAIAHQWHGTRYKAWPRVVQFVAALPAGSLVADLGCGNGKLAPSFRAAGHFGVGCDFSAELVRIAAVQMGLQAQAADVMALPYRSGTFDAAVSIAVLHHVATKARRRLLVREALRVLRPGGRALLYAWAMEQGNGGVSGHAFAAQDVFVPWHQRRAEAAAAADARDAASGEYVGGKGGLVLQRYCHVYREGELTELVASVAGARLVDEYYDVGNWCVLLEKVT